MTEKTTPEAPKNVHDIIALISQEAGALVPVYSEGLKFAFRGVNQVIDHLAPHFDHYGLTVAPKVLSHKVEMHPVGNRFLTDSEVIVEYTFEAPDGSKHSVSTLGYAQDYADRSAAQAQSVAFRVALLQTFHLPSSDIEPEENGKLVQETTEKELSKTAAAAKVSPIDEVRAKITALIKNPETPYSGAMVNEIGNRISGKTPDEWDGNLTTLRAILKAMEAGEVA